MDGTCGVPFRGGRGFIYDTEGAPGGDVHGGDGVVASTGDSGYSMSALDDLARVMVIGACS